MRRRGGSQVSANCGMEGGVEVASHPNVPSPLDCALRDVGRFWGFVQAELRIKLASLVIAAQVVGAMVSASWPRVSVALASQVEGRWLVFLFESTCGGCAWLHLEGRG